MFAAQLVLSIVIGAIGAIGDSVAWRALLQLVQSLILAPVWALAAAIVYFALREARGDSPLAQPTGVLSGGFVPPVPPGPAPAAAGRPGAARSRAPEQPVTAAAPRAAAGAGRTSSPIPIAAQPTAAERARRAAAARRHLRPHPRRPSRQAEPSAAPEPVRRRARARAGPIPTCGHPNPAPARAVRARPRAERSAARLEAAGNVVHR